MSYTLPPIFIDVNSIFIKKMDLVEKSLFNELNEYKVQNGERILWTALRNEKPQADGFILFKQLDWVDRCKIPLSTLKRYLKSLESKRLIRREYRYLTIHDPYPIEQDGRYLLLKVLPPETENDMTFFGKFDFIETKALSSEKVLRTAIFRDVYNIPDTINLSYAFCDLEENCPKSRVLENMERGDSVFFKGCVRRNIKGRACIVNIWNIRPIEEFYANR